MTIFERAGELKEELVAYALRPRYDRPRGEVLADFGVTTVHPLADSGPVDEDEERLVRALDYFILEHRLRNGRTVLEQFVSSRKDLPDQEREMLLGWHDVVHGVFEVERRAGDGVETVNLVDDLPYRVRSNLGPSAIARARPSSFMLTSVVPIGEEWMISGITVIRPASESRWALRLAFDMAMADPEAVYRNPEKLRRAWELQRLDRERFIRFFGSDTVVVPGAELQDRMDAYWDFARSEASGAPSHDSASPVLELPAALTSSPSVGVIHDAVDGLGYFADFGLVQAVFADPGLLRDEEHRKRVLAYLHDETVDPSVLRRLAEPDHDRASEVFKEALNRPEFDWERDGEALLREHKAAYFEREPRPAITPVSERISAAVRGGGTRGG